MPERKSTLTIMTEVSTIVGTLVAIAGLAFTLYFSSHDLSGRPLSIPSVQSSVSRQPPHNSPSPYPSTSGSVVPSPSQNRTARDTPTPTVSATRPPVSTPTYSTKVASSWRNWHWRAPWSVKLGLIYGFSYLIASPILGLFFGFFDFRDGLIFLIMTVLALTLGIVYSKLVQPQPSIAYQLLVLLPFWGAVFVFAQIFCYSTANRLKS